MSNAAVFYDRDLQIHFLQFRCELIVNSCRAAPKSSNDRDDWSVCFYPATSPCFKIAGLFGLASAGEALIRVRDVYMT